jgi:hypothetical protein
MSVFGQKLIIVIIVLINQEILCRGILELILFKNTNLIYLVRRGVKNYSSSKILFV